MAINNFNRVIDLSLYSRDDKYFEKPLFQLRCPRSGRKPNITITATLTGTDSVQPFNVTIKNLYIDRAQEYGKIKVSAGYEGSSVTAFIGNIMTMYQEQPGPESVVVIQCTTAKFQNWTDKTIDLELPEGFTVREALNRITTLAEFDSPMISPEIQMSSPAPMIHQGSVQQAVHRLREVFPRINVICVNNRLYAYPIAKSNGQTAKVLRCLTTPPQAIAGENGISFVHIAAPWQPDVKPGDDVTFNSGYFKSKIGSKAAQTSTMNVISMEVQFSTVGSINKMTLKGGITS